jgi:hypothetical protein
MGKVNVFTVLTAVVVQFVVGYLWYGPHLFGDVITAGGGHAIDFLKLDSISLLLIILSGFGLTHVLGMLNKVTGTKDINGGIRLGLTVGALAIGFPVALLLSLMGIGKVALLVIFIYLVLITVVTNIVVIKLKHS